MRVLGDRFLVGKSPRSPRITRIFKHPRTLRVPRMLQDSRDFERTQDPQAPQKPTIPRILGLGIPVILDPGDLGGWGGGRRKQFSNTLGSPGSPGCSRIPIILKETRIFKLPRNPRILRIRVLGILVIRDPGDLEEGGGANFGKLGSFVGEVFFGGRVLILFDQTLESYESGFWGFW